MKYALHCSLAIGTRWVRGAARPRAPGAEQSARASAHVGAGEAVNSPGNPRGVLPGNELPGPR